MHKKIQALGRLPVGTMNDTEKEYAQRLEILRQAGEIVWFKFEAIKLRLAANTFYTPDFAVLNKKMELELHEVKGFWAEDARVKIKVAADQYPIFKIIAVTKGPKKEGGGWAVEEF